MRSWWTICRRNNVHSWWNHKLLFSLVLKLCMKVPNGKVLQNWMANENESSTLSLFIKYKGREFHGKCNTNCVIQTLHYRPKYRRQYWCKCCRALEWKQKKPRTYVTSPKKGRTSLFKFFCKCIIWSLNRCSQAKQKEWIKRVYISSEKTFLMSKRLRIVYFDILPIKIFRSSNAFQSINLKMYAKLFQ